MKRILLFVLLFIQLAIYANNGVQSINVEMNNMKDFFIKFPYEIKYVDIGSQNFMTEKCLGNILKVKTNKSNFEKTNLIVVTTDGKYYSFIVDYNNNPSFIAVDMTNVCDSIKPTDIIKSANIEVSDVHTTHIILPTKVEHIKMGNEKVFCEKAESIDNIVKLRSLVDDNQLFDETSVTVVTSDGNIYPMNVTFAKNPKDMSVSFLTNRNVFFKDVNGDEMSKVSEWIISKGQYINNLGKQDSKMIFQLYSVFTNQDIIAFHLYVQNNSKVDYSIDFVKAYISNKKLTKYTVTQFEELYPEFIYYSNKNGVIRGNDKMDIVLIYKKFTLVKDRLLNFELYEDNGGRNLGFTAPNRVIINAEVIDEN